MFRPASVEDRRRPGGSGPVHLRDARIARIVREVEAIDWSCLLTQLDGSRHGYLELGERLEDIANHLLEASDLVSEQVQRLNT